MDTYSDDQMHPILPYPYLWDLVEFSFHKESLDWEASYIDLVFEKDGVRRRLRFMGPQSLELSVGLPNSCGMIILDVRHRQMDGIRVRVTTFEQSYGVPEFWASSVIEVFEDS